MPARRSDRDRRGDRRAATAGSRLGAARGRRDPACRVFPAADFADALAFTAKVGSSRRPRASPALLTEWGRTTVSWWTHKIKGLHRNDFIMAAKTDQLYAA